MRNGYWTKLEGERSHRKCLDLDGNIKFGFLERERENYYIWVLISPFSPSLDNIFERTDWQTLFKNVQSGWKVCISITLQLSANLKGGNVRAIAHRWLRKADQSRCLNWGVKASQDNKKRTLLSSQDNKIAEPPPPRKNVKKCSVAEAFRRKCGGWPQDLVNQARASLKAP